MTALRQSRAGCPQAAPKGSTARKAHAQGYRIRSRRERRVRRQDPVRLGASHRRSRVARHPILDGMIAAATTHLRHRALQCQSEDVQTQIDDSSQPVQVRQELPCIPLEHARRHCASAGLALLSAALLPCTNGSLYRADCDQLQLRRFGFVHAIVIFPELVRRFARRRGRSSRQERHERCAIWRTPVKGCRRGSAV